jgi:hypothetical protein
MANFTFDIAKGRVAEFYNRAKTNDPANSALVVIILATTGLESDTILQRKTDMSAMVSGTTREVTNTNYTRKTIKATLAALAPDYVNDRTQLTMPNMTWTAVAAGSGWSKLLITYDNDTTGGTDTNLIPLTAHDFIITPDGSDITAQIAAAGFYQAS